MCLAVLISELSTQHSGLCTVKVVSRGSPFTPRSAVAVPGDLDCMVEYVVLGDVCWLSEKSLCSRRADEELTLH